ncbi:hypothetical protein [Peribacillus frigoritolerans]|uniref:hypothetical protein n=1 Tax=Peribacillus frigoritolerans TaxID=450367 RepID=UPI0023DBA8CF|nr:hypothetical protein [Peribacillus frigoritolerans]MDF1995800.1 hypothetical protein [Peribacillus frigoritolerans]
MWGLYVQSSMSFSMARKSFSNDLYIFSTFDNSEHETYFLGSPHLDSIAESDSDQAYYRAKALIRLLNGCLLLRGDLTFTYDEDICFFRPNSVIKAYSNRKNDLSIVEYEELVNPFGSNVEVKEQAEQSYLRDCLILAKENPLIRQTIVFLVLSKLDALYFLTNTFKIYEIILSDLGINKNKATYKRELQNNFPEGIRKYIDFFLLGNFKEYVNSEKGAGILSRHVSTNQPYDKAPLDLEEIDSNIRNFINHWLRIKMQERFGYYYTVEYKPSREEYMKDEDYDF